MNFTFQARVWQYQGHAAWHFVTLPTDVSDDIKRLTTGNVRGFGSVKITAQIGDSVWQTSIFPDSKSGCYMLPLKKSVRQKEELNAADEVTVKLLVEV